MKNPDNREIMTRIYRLVERYEEVPRMKYTVDASDYFAGLYKECKDIYGAFPDSEIARGLTVGFYTAVWEKYKKTNPVPLETKPEQITML